MPNNSLFYARKRITSPMGRGRDISADELISSEERLVYRLSRCTPGLSQAQIAEKLRKNQGQISRILQSAIPKVEEMKRLCELAGGDPNVIDRYLDQ